MGMSIEWVGTTRLNKASELKQAVDWVKFLASLKFLFMSSGILLLITGIYLAAVKWGWTPWIIVSFLLWIFLTVQGSAITGRKVNKFGKSLESASDISSSDLTNRIGKLKLMGLLQSRLVIALGAVFIMTVKPDLIGAIVVVIVAIILGVVPMFSKPKIDAAKPA